MVYYIYVSLFLCEEVLLLSPIVDILSRCTHPRSRCNTPYGVGDLLRSEAQAMHRDSMYYRMYRLSMSKGYTVTL